MPPVVIDLRSAEDTRDVVHRAVQALVEGQLVAFPTETVYGIAASGLCEEAVARVSEIRHPSPDRPLTLAVKSIDDALDYVPKMSPLARRLARRCWPGPATLVLPNNCEDSVVHSLPAKVHSAVCPNDYVSLRVPAHETILEVLRLVPGPVVLTSANRQGEPPAITAEAVVESLGDAVHLIVDDGRSRYGQSSTVVRVDGRRFETLREGVVPPATLERLASFMVVMVCTGNTCRSPMAEAMFRKLLADRLGCQVSEVGDRGVLVMSAGIAAMLGARAAAEGVQIMAQRGLDLTEHETHPLTEQLVRHADLILTMTRTHRQAILSQWPDAADRTKLLARDRSDIADPIGGPLEMYERCAAQLEEHLKAWVDDLELNGNE